MLKQLSLFAKFFQEIAFDTKAEGDFTSVKFNARKFIVVGITALSLTLNYLTADRLYDAAKKLYAAKAEIKELKKQVEDLKKCVREKNCRLPSDDAKGDTPIFKDKPPDNRK